jgi:hypothetical protein
MGWPRLGSRRHILALAPLVAQPSRPVFRTIAFTERRYRPGLFNQGVGFRSTGSVLAVLGAAFQAARLIVIGCSLRIGPLRK